MPAEEVKEQYIVKSTRDPIKIPELTLSEYLYQKISAQDPERIALIDSQDGTKLTYEQLNRKIQQYGQGFLNSGITKTDSVLFFADNNLEYFYSQFALIYLGVVFVPASPGDGAYELANKLRDSNASILIIDRYHVETVLFLALENEKYASVIKKLKKIIIFDPDENMEMIQKLKQHPKTPEQIISIKQISENQSDHLERIPYFETSKDDCLFIVYTSGTTGLPKGVIHTHFTMVSFIELYKPVICPAIYSFWLPMGHISGSIVSCYNLCYGMTLVLEADYNLENLLSSVEKYKITQLVMSPSHSTDLARENFHLKYNLESLRMISYGGSKVPQKHIDEIQQKYNVMMFNMYGSSEMMGPTCMCFDGTDPPGTVGRPISNCEIKIVDLKTGQNLPPNSNGELCCRGPQRFVGYLNNEEATAKSIDSNGWYHSGDLAYFDEQGNLFIMDRIKEMTKFRFWSVSPIEVEEFLSGHPAVDAVCVVGVKHQIEGQWLRAYVEIRPGHQITEQELIKYAKDNLGFNKQLRAGVKFVKQLGRTSIGKVDRKLCRKWIEHELLTDPVED
ncbi:uncharacterized protein LOC113799499 [Dermatophagoides pteronyssinus]|uniref:uncharacterized protein LOC113799499 n=1 Tax=Dermatophagoides pteronyssinus TaxID=6956 RepID=UPI003F66D79C